jgi:hypothetical protein
LSNFSLGGVTGGAKTQQQKLTAAQQQAQANTNALGFMQPQTYKYAGTPLTATAPYKSTTAPNDAAKYLTQLAMMNPSRQWYQHLA